MNISQPVSLCLQTYNTVITSSSTKSCKHSVIHFIKFEILPARTESNNVKDDLLDIGIVSSFQGVKANFILFVELWKERH